MTKVRQLLFVGVIFFFLVLLNFSCVDRRTNSRPTDQMGERNDTPSFPAKNTFDEIFAKDGEIQLSTGPDHLIGEIPRIAVSKQGFILVGDPFLTRSVYLFGGDGSFIRRIGSRGQGPGEYLYPQFQAFDKSGNVYIYDGDQLKLLKYDQNGEYKTSFFIGKYLHFAEFDTAHNMYFCTSAFYDPRSSTDATIFKYDVEGRLLASFCPQSEIFLPGMQYHGGGIALDSDGFVYQISPYEYKIQKFNSDGNAVILRATAPPSYRPPSNFSRELLQYPTRLADWHKSWTHIWHLFLLENRYLMVITQNVSSKGLPEYRFDLYDKEGKMLTSGVNLPPGEQNYAAQGKFLFSVKGNKPDKNGRLHNPSIIRYVLR